VAAKIREEFSIPISYISALLDEATKQRAELLILSSILRNRLLTKKYRQLSMKRLNSSPNKLSVTDFTVEFEQYQKNN
jgi:hypothetical protein